MGKMIYFIKEIYQEIDGDKTSSYHQKIPDELAEKITVQQYQDNTPTSAIVVKP